MLAKLNQFELNKDGWGSAGVGVEVMEMLQVEGLSKTGTGNCWESSLLWIQRLGILLKVGGNVREGRDGEVLLTVTVEGFMNGDFCPFLLFFFLFLF